MPIPISSSEVETREKAIKIAKNMKEKRKKYLVEQQLKELEKEVRVMDLEYVCREDLETLLNTIRVDYTPILYKYQHLTSRGRDLEGLVAGMINLAKSRELILREQIVDAEGKIKFLQSKIRENGGLFKYRKSINSEYITELGNQTKRKIKLEIELFNHINGGQPTIVDMFVERIEGKIKSFGGLVVRAFK